MRKLVIIALTMLAALLLAGATGDPKGRFSAKLTGANVRPAVASDATGRFWIRFNKENTEAEYYLKVRKGKSLTQAHLHCHNAGLNNPIAVSLSEHVPRARGFDTIFGLITRGFDTNGKWWRDTLTNENLGTQGFNCGIGSLSDLRQAIERGHIYVNVQSAAHPSGEIQGQVSYFRKDTDEDGIRDTRDPDIDGDGLPNAKDPAPYQGPCFKVEPPAPPASQLVTSQADFANDSRLSAAAVREVTFRADFEGDGGGALTCNPNGGPPKTIEGSNTNTCQFTQCGQIIITRDNWEGQTAVLNEDGTIFGSCDGSLIANPNPDDYNLINSCQKAPPPKPPDRQDATGDLLLEEWFTDIPWHQKLSTKDSNLIDVPFVLPFEALAFPNAQCQSATSAIDKSRCMLRYGIVSVMGMKRTDRLYVVDPEKDINEAAHSVDQDCQDGTCVEVKLQVQRFHTLTDHPDGYEADTITNDAYSYKDPNPPPDVEPGDIRVPSLGFAITEATIFAPWLPWYTGHYCAQKYDDVHDAVCYEDYFTTQLIAPAGPGEFWLRDNPALFVPNGAEPTYEKFCMSGKTACDLYLGKVDWLKNGTAYATKPMVREDVDCKTFVLDDKGNPVEEEVRDADGNVIKKLVEKIIPHAECQQEVEDRTKNLVDQFNFSITDFKDQGRFPWRGGEEEQDQSVLSGAIQTNPFIGAYNLTWFAADRQGGGAPPPPEPRYRSFFNGKPYVLPKACTTQNFLGARQGTTADINALKDCAVNFEIHTSGFHEIWETLYGGSLTGPNVEEINEALPGFAANQYGRTLFMLAGVPEQKLPASYAVQNDGISIYDKMYGSSLYTQYLPLVNPADLTLKSKDYTDAYWHNILMSNHMNQTPDHFIRGIRGRTLWHNEYRSQVMYQSWVEDDGKKLKGTPFETALRPVDFPAGFQTGNHQSPFHGNTCDSCHVRNGSGIPLMPNGNLPEIHDDRGMSADTYDIRRDYTYSNPNLPSMKMVLFDLNDPGEPLEQCDVNDHAVPRELYTNKIMNFYGNSFHVNQEAGLPTYTMAYEAITDKSGFEIVVKVDENDKPIIRQPKESNTVYTPQRIAISNINTGNQCQGIADNPDPDTVKNWPQSCVEVNGDAVSLALNGNSDTPPEVGFLNLIGRRLGNTPLIEMIPNQTIRDTHSAQTQPPDPAVKDATLAPDPEKVGLTYPGCYGRTPGTRGGGATHYRSCDAENGEDCYISRWGWIGDRASLEDQIANAASVEMNITSKESYNEIHQEKKALRQLVRYNKTLCGPADAGCQGSNPNSDITEQEIKDMATYQRWIGIPNRSEYQVSSQIVQEGEKVFERLKCHSCHVISKIPYVENDNMLPDEERTHLSRLKILSGNETDYPFISYLGTDLLLHDMGYLSQVAKAPDEETIRDPDNGTVKDEFKAYVQPIRTPALKGLRFNRFVTDSNHNTKTGEGDITVKKDFEPGCDFLLHDGRACDAIEATFLHDGPAVKELRMIEALNNLSPEELRQLRAFLYSL